MKITIGLAYAIWETIGCDGPSVFSSQLVVRNTMLISQQSQTTGQLQSSISQVYHQYVKRAWSDCVRFFSNLLRFWYQKIFQIFLITPGEILQLKKFER